MIFVIIGIFAFHIDLLFWFLSALHLNYFHFAHSVMLKHIDSHACMDYIIAGYEP